MTRPTAAPSTRTGSEPSGHCPRIGEDEAGQQPLRRARGEQRLAADETLLVELDGKAEPRLVRVVVGRDVGAPDAIALLEAHRVDRAVAAGDETEVASRLPDRIPEREPELGWAVQLPAELADVGHAQREARDVADRQLAGVHVGEVERRRRQRLEDLARPRSPESEACVRRGDVLDRDVARRVLADPREIVLAEGRPGHDPEPIVGEPGDGEVALDSAARVQHRGVGDGAHVARDPVCAQPLEERSSALAGDLDLRERRLVEERRRLAAGDVLGADRGRPEPARPAARPQRLVSAGGVRLEPVRALPARLLAEGRTQPGEAAVRRRDAQRPAGRPLVAGVLHVVVGLVDLDRARQRVRR